MRMCVGSHALGLVCPMVIIIFYIYIFRIYIYTYTNRPHHLLFFRFVVPRPFRSSLFPCFLPCLVRRLLPQPHRGTCIAICVLSHIDLPMDNRKHNTNPSTFTLSMLVSVVYFCCVMEFATVSHIYVLYILYIVPLSACTAPLGLGCFLS